MDGVYKIVVKSEEETIELAQKKKKKKIPNMVICLNGELGSGKTVFTKAFASAMGIEETTSPTFNIVKEYYGELPLYHMDMYRTDGKVDSNMIEEYFDKNGVTIIEWADMISDYLPKERLDIQFKIVDENTRIILLKPYGQEYIDICEDVI